MRSLREVQLAFAGALLSRNAAAFASSVRSDRLCGADRLQVYQNNTFISLTQALADVYPVVERLVGEAFFRQAARRFIQTHPSRSGNLHDFGCEFAQFLRGLHETQALPYLADVAALEWAVHEVFHAAEATPLDVERLALMPEAEHDALRFQLHPATRLVVSRYPILAIWKANRGDAPSSSEIRLDAGTDYLLVARLDFDPAIARLTPGEFTLLSELAAGATLAQACAAAVSADVDIDLGLTMGRFVADRTLSGFHTS